MIDVPPQVNDIRLGFEDAGVALMPPRFRNIPDETVKALASCLVITTFSAVTTDASWLVPSSTNALTNSMWQSSEICEVLSTGAFTLFCHDVHGFTEDFLSFVTFVFVSCSRVCLLVVSRLLGLTLRPSAPVCCCHRASLTRWRLAFQQEGLELLLLRLPICSFESQCASWFLTACEECPFKRSGRMKVLLPS